MEAKQEAKDEAKDESEADSDEEEHQHEDKKKGKGSKKGWKANKQGGKAPKQNYQRPAKLRYKHKMEGKKFSAMVEESKDCWVGGVVLRCLERCRDGVYKLKMP